MLKAAVARVLSFGIVDSGTGGPVFECLYRQAGSDQRSGSRRTCAVVGHLLRAVSVAELLIARVCGSRGL